MSRGASSALPPAPALHAPPATRLSQLLTALSPKRPSAPDMTSPQRPTSPQARGSPRGSPGLRSPSRFGPGPIRASPTGARHAGSGMVTPDKPKAVQRSLLRHKPASRVLSPEGARAMCNVLSSRHICPESNQQACAAGHSPVAAVVGSDKLGSAHQAQPVACSWRPRPGSATFSTGIPQIGSTEQQTGLSHARPAPLRSPFASVANQLSASKTAKGHGQAGSLAELAACPQSASFSNKMLHVGSRSLDQQPASSPTASGLHSVDTLSEAAAPQDQLHGSLAGFPAAGPLTGAAPPDALLAQADLQPTGAIAEGGPQDRPTSAFAPIADLPAPMAWQATNHDDPPMAEQPTCAEVTGNDQQVGCCEPDYIGCYALWL